ncbi:dethiobiotin synthase [uncultured Roseibium sp.]|uniref:dethiobiotin synthase n=1 Tax=uncultured Roseibium sp. TaxID=1936171 RepID=UPI00260F04AC|nr:dethiobiotin synthase [uncultured Roseibium sp.]
MSAIIVTGTDTGVGKTISAAGLTMALGAAYWKPVQAGLDGATDTETVAALTGCPTLPEAYRLNLPGSPHLAAEDMGIDIKIANLALPPAAGPLVVEGAGGVMVPLDRKTFFVDVFARWKAPVLLVALTGLGTINHSALSIAALRTAGCPIAGLIFNGVPDPAAEQTVVEMCGVRHLGRIAPIGALNRKTLANAFQSIDIESIRGLL